MRKKGPEKLQRPESMELRLSLIRLLKGIRAESRKMKFEIEKDSK